MVMPADQTPEQSALAIAARIAHALDPDGWARCPGCVVLDHEYTCDRPRGHAGDHEQGPGGREPLGVAWEQVVVPLPPTLAEAKAEWAAAGGDPERGPALSGRSADGRVEWSIEVFRDGGVYTTIVIGRLSAHRNTKGRWGIHYHHTVGDATCPADVLELGRLMAAADGGTCTTT